MCVSCRKEKSRPCSIELPTLTIIHHIYFLSTFFDTISDKYYYAEREERQGANMDFMTLVSEVGFPIAGAIAAGGFVFLTLKFILAGVTDSVTTLKNIIGQLDNRVQTMNNDLVKIDALLSYTLGVKPNVDRIAANEGKEDARRD